MNVNYTAADLIAFEDDIAQCFLNKQILAPVHLEGGSEAQLLDVFKKHVEPEDWLLCSWRSHLKCLLKGVPPSELRTAILRGRSIDLCFPEYRILSSAIVGGTAPIAVGLAMGIKRKQEKRKVICFLGDMTARTGIVYEAMQYAYGHDLPVLWVVEDNGLSTMTPTREVWGGDLRVTFPNVVHYTYTNFWPHVGVGKFVQF